MNGQFSNGEYKHATVIIVQYLGRIGMHHVIPFRNIEGLSRMSCECFKPFLDKIEIPLLLVTTFDKKLYNNVIRCTHQWLVGSFVLRVEINDVYAILPTLRLHVNNDESPLRSYCDRNKNFRHVKKIDT